MWVRFCAAARVRLPDGRLLLTPYTEEQELSLGPAGGVLAVNQAGVTQISQIPYLRDFDFETLRFTVREKDKSQLTSLIVWFMQRQQREVSATRRFSQLLRCALSNANRAGIRITNECFAGYSTLFEASGKRTILFVFEVYDITLNAVGMDELRRAGTPDSLIHFISPQQILNGKVEYTNGLVVPVHPLSSVLLAPKPTIALP